MNFIPGSDLSHLGAWSGLRARPQTHFWTSESKYSGGFVWAMVNLYCGRDTLNLAVGTPRVQSHLGFLFVCLFICLFDKFHPSETLPRVGNRSIRKGMPLIWGVKPPEDGVNCFCHLWFCPGWGTAPLVNLLIPPDPKIWLIFEQRPFCCSLSCLICLFVCPFVLIVLLLVTPNLTEHSLLGTPSMSPKWTKGFRYLCSEFL